MNNKYYTGKQFTLKYLPRKLKWYEKILQKLHIKNYYKEIKGTGALTYIGEENE